MVPTAAPGPRPTNAGSPIDAHRRPASARRRVRSDGDDAGDARIRRETRERTAFAEKQSRCRPSLPPSGRKGCALILWCWRHSVSRRVRRENAS